MGKLSNGTDDHIVILFWGPPKTGKTVLASQFPSPTFIDLDGGMSSVRAMRADAGLNFDFSVFDIDENPSNDPDMLELIGANFVKTHPWVRAKKLFEVLCRTLGPDETLVFDNLSRASEHLVDYIKKTTGHNPMQIQDWGTFASEMTDLAFHSKKAKCNVIFIGHEQYKEDSLSKELRKTLLIPGSAAHRIPSIISDFIYLKHDVTGPSAKPVVKRIAQTVADKTNAVGSRSLIPNLEDPTYLKMKPYLEKALNRTLPEPTWTPKP